MKVTQELLDRINENIEGCKVELHLVKKNNIEKEGLMLIVEGNTNYVYPTIYVDDLDDFYDVLKRIKCVLKRKVPAFDMEAILTREYVMSHVRAGLVSKDSIVLEQEGVTTRAFLDMNIVYRLVVSADSEMGSILINDGILKHAGVSEDELFNIVKAYDEYELENLFEVVLRMSNSLNEESKGDYPEIYLISSKDKFYGASVLITDLMEGLMNNISTACYILPCSVHEVILVPDKEHIDPEKLADLVKIVNATEVQPEDRLTDSVYYIDKDGIRKVA